MSLINRCKRLALALVLCLASLAAYCNALGEVIWAMNCGGDSHTDIHGIRYQRDTLRAGVASDYGKSLIIQRINPQDQILYQTERYDGQNFAYEVPVTKDGNYVLVLKFSEVWFTQPNQKVFDVALNGMTVVDSLDIFTKVGRGVAHDEIVTFTVKNGNVKYDGETLPMEGNKLSIEFVKGDQDNPKINAIYVMRGSMDDVPQLQPMQNPQESRPPLEEEEEDEELEEESPKKEKKRRPPAGPKVQDPYAADDTGSMMLPVLIAIGAFIPLLFCLCRL